MQHLLIIYLYVIANAFLAGIAFGEDYHIHRTVKEKWITILTIIVMLLFGVVIHTLYHIITGLRWVWNKLNTTFQLTFWFLLYFTKQYDHIDEDRLYDVNRRLQNRIDTTLANRMYRKAIMAANKRNNYTYQERPEPEF